VPAPAQENTAVGGSGDLIAAAAAELHLDRSALDHIIELLEDKRQVILYGPPGTGKTYLAKTLARALTGGDAARSTIVQFHPAMSYEDFVEGLRPEETEAGQVMYRLRDGHLMHMVKRALGRPESRHVMVIDEINRANLPKVLGELLFLLEYRDDAVPLLYEPEASFRLPKDLWLTGTMNTADRSIALIDAALRRRFHFVPFFPTQPPIDGLLEQFLEDGGLSTAPAAFLRAVNADLLTKQGIDEHVLIGPSHFMNAKHYVDGVLPETVLERIWTYNVFPLIEELLWGQKAEIDSWRWPKVRMRFATELGLALPSHEPAVAHEAASEG
jgi:5-methylcytosine-specific restriction enzyme B